MCFPCQIVKSLEAALRHSQSHDFRELWSRCQDSDFDDCSDFWKWLTILRYLSASDYLRFFRFTISDFIVIVMVRLQITYLQQQLQSGTIWFVIAVFVVIVLAAACEWLAMLSHSRPFIHGDILANESHSLIWNTACWISIVLFHPLQASVNHAFWQILQYLLSFHGGRNTTSVGAVYLTKPTVPHDETRNRTHVSPNQSSQIYKFSHIWPYMWPYIYI